MAIPAILDPSEYDPNAPAPQKQSTIISAVPEKAIQNEARIPSTHRSELGKSQHPNHFAVVNFENSRTKAEIYIECRNQVLSLTRNIHVLKLNIKF